MATSMPASSRRRTSAKLSQPLPPSYASRPCSYPPPSAPPATMTAAKSKPGHRHSSRTVAAATRPQTLPHVRTNTETLGQVLAASGTRMQSASSDRDKVRTTTRVLSLATQYLRTKIEGFSSFDLTAALSLSGGGEGPSSSSLSRGGSGSANFGTLRPVPRQFLSYHVRQRENGAWQATVSLVQPFVRGLWTDPQGTRPGLITMGFYGTEEGALAACANNAPPVWTEPSKGCICYMCQGGAKSLHKSPLHCRNCGQLVCAKCSKSRWPRGMVPPTYHNNERTVRVCDGCNHLAWNFRRALKEGEKMRALELYASGNVNVWSPYVLEQVREFPVHCAAEGGDLDLLRWLVDELGCPLYDADAAPLLTQQGDSVLGVAARHHRVSVMRWLVQIKECKISEIGERQQLWNTIDFLLRGGRILANGEEEEDRRSRRVIAREEEEEEEEEESDDESEDDYPPRPRASVLRASASATKRASSSKRQTTGCAVCRVKEVDCMVLPCGHLCACSGCASRCKDCPTCYTRINKVVRTFGAGSS